MNPKIWGPHLWFILHIITFKYPKNPTSFDKEYHRDFFTNLKNVIPCDDCKKSYAKHIQEYPITPHLDSRESLINWLVQIHNLVNVSLNKKVISTKEMINIYSNINPISPFNESNKKIKNQTKFEYINLDTEKNIKTFYYLILVCIIIICIIKWHYHKYYFNY